MKQLSAKEAGYVTRKNKTFSARLEEENKNLQHPTKKENKNLGMGGKNGSCYFELNESFQNPNIASFPDITLTPCPWFIVPYKVANENR